MVLCHGSPSRLTQKLKFTELPAPLLYCCVPQRFLAALNLIGSAISLHSRWLYYQHLVDFCVYFSIGGHFLCLLPNCSYSNMNWLWLLPIFLFFLLICKSTFCSEYIESQVIHYANIFSFFFCFLLRLFIFWHEKA